MSDYKTGYSYSPVTGELMGTEIVYKEKATGQYPCAANVVFAKPPKPGDHQAVVYDKDEHAWKLVTDYRGERWYKPDGQDGGIIERLGEVSEILAEPPEQKEHIVRSWDEKRREWQESPESGYIAENGQVRPMTPAERIQAGLDTMPEGAYIDKGEVVFYTQEELLEQGKISLDEYNEYIREMRESEYRYNTDKLGLMVLRGETTREEWLAAIQAVKDKWPYKE